MPTSNNNNTAERLPPRPLAPAERCHHARSLRMTIICHLPRCNNTTTTHRGLKSLIPTHPTMRKWAANHLHCTRTRGEIVIHTGWWRPCLLIIIRQQSHHRYRRTIVINIVILVTIIVIIVTIIIIIVIIILLIILPRRYHPLNPTIYIIRDTEGQHLHSPPTPLIIQGNV